MELLAYVRPRHDEILVVPHGWRTVVRCCVGHFAAVFRNARTDSEDKNKVRNEWLDDGVRHEQGDRRIGRTEARIVVFETDVVDALRWRNEDSPAAVNDDPRQG